MDEKLEKEIFDKMKFAERNIIIYLAFKTGALKKSELARRNGISATQVHQIINKIDRMKKRLAR